jgi:hypothetical protein
VKLIQIPASHVEWAWGEGAHLLSEACKRSDEVTAEQLKKLLLEGKRTLLAAVDGSRALGWAVVGAEDLPNYRALSVFAAYAPGAIVLDQIKEYARHNGCTAVRICCDDAGARLWARRGARKKYQVMEWAV